MPLPSFYASTERARAWSVTRAAAYGAGVGALAALFKTFGPLHGAAPAAARVFEIAVVAAVFALSCGAAALLRNFVARRFIWPDLR
jgi:hypothetical protein